MFVFFFILLFIFVSSHVHLCTVFPFCVFIFCFFLSTFCYVLSLFLLIGSSSFLFFVLLLLLPDFFFPTLAFCCFSLSNPLRSDCYALCRRRKPPTYDYIQTGNFMLLLCSNWTKSVLCSSFILFFVFLLLLLLLQIIFFSFFIFQFSSLIWILRLNRFESNRTENWPKPS